MKGDNNFERTTYPPPVKLLSRIRERIVMFLKPRGRNNFLRMLPRNAKLLDVGCGNHSPENTKRIRSDLYYVGIDVGDYNTDELSKKLADEYIITTGEDFANTIKNLPHEFDAAVSWHNLEHCNKPMETIDAICSRLKTGGRLYMGFPSEQSVIFPSRKGTLNFYDDETHQYVPVFKDVIKRLVKDNRMFIDFVAQNHQPIFYRAAGIFIDRIITDRNTKFTWPHYGFETVIWAHKR